MRERTKVGLALLPLCGAACFGAIGEPYPGRGDGAGPGAGGVLEDGSFECDPEGAPSVSPLRRLSAQQYRNTLQDLFASTLGIDVGAVAATELDRLPVDVATFQIMDRRLSDQHVRAYYRIADRLASAIVGDDEQRRALAGDCALEAIPSADCVAAFLDDFGSLVFRRPLTPDEHARYAALNDGTRDGRELLRALLFSLLQAPSFVYHFELEGEGSDTLYQLDAYELASRLSYHFWQSMPDEPLRAAAEDGSLMTDEGYAAQVDRLFDNPRTRETVRQFYTEWWKVGWLQSFPSTAAFATFAEGTTIGQPDADHLQAMTDEVHALAEHFTFETSGTLRDLFTTDLSFTRSPHLAALYGVEPWDGVSEYPHMPAGQRAGILTRGAFLLNDSHVTHPVHRGALVRRRLLCDPMQQPDPASLPDGALTPPPVTTDQTTRQRYEQKTRNQPCAGCHQAMNPIGFALERYDAIGRFRTEEMVIDEATGEVLARLPIDSSVTIDLNGEVAIDSGVGLSEEVANSDRTESCFARQYFRFTFGRDEEDIDGCTLEQVRDVLASGGSLRDALRSIALDPAFRTRRVD